MFDFTGFSEPVEITASDVLEGDYLERAEILAPHGVYEGRRITKGMVNGRTENPGLDGKLSFDLVNVLSEHVELRLHPEEKVTVRRRDRR